MSILLRTMMGRMASRIIYEGVITSGDLHIATRDGEAMFFHDSIDFSAYAGTDGGSTPYRLVFTDSAGKVAIAYGGAAGGGKALGADLFSGWDLTAGWAASALASIVDADTFTLTGSNGYVRKDVATAGRLYDVGFNASHAATFLRDLAGNYSIGVGAGATIVNAITSSNIIILFSTAGASTDIISLSMSPYTDIPATGLHLMSAKNGTARNMASVETGFNPNAVTGVKIYG